MVSDAGVAEVLVPSNAADYLESLGLRYSQRLQRTAVDISATRPVADPTQIYAIESDVLVVIRTDRLAGRGGYDGLPRQPPLSGRQPVTAHHLRADAATRVRRRPRGAAVRVLCIALPARVMRRWPRLICL
jgi:hypothetical protein